MADEFIIRSRLVPSTQPNRRPEQRGGQAVTLKGELVTVNGGRKEEPSHVTYLKIKVFEQKEIFKKWEGTEVQITLS